MPIQAALIEPLSVEIARLFDPPDLERIMLRATGEGLYEVWVGRDLPDRKMCFELMQEISRRGVERNVLGEMLARRPADAAFSALVDQCCPEARAALPTTALQVDALMGGLQQVQAQLTDPQVRAALLGSGEKLKTISGTIDSLDAYKTLHECLHQLAQKQFRALRDAARTLPDNPQTALELRSYRNELRNACLSARNAVRKLPDAPVVRATEYMWIEDLEAAGDQFHQAIDERKGDVASSALRKIRRIMLTTPPRLNALIFASATQLPLDELTGALTQATAGGGAAVAAALASLRTLIPAIHSRVVEHRSWQDADVRISEIDQLLEHPGDGVIEEFAADWLELKALVLGLTGLEPGADWAVRVERYAGQVDDNLARETVDAEFLDAFGAFRSDAQYHFLIVDSELKTDCEALVRIGEPLHRILAELEQ